MRKLLGNIAIVVLSTVVTLGILELILQFVYPAHESWRMYSVPDPELGWTLEPGAEFNRYSPGGLVKVRYNAQGFRDSDFSESRDENALRIVVLGDSYMEANMVSLDQVFHKQLERIARSDGRKFITFNLGVAGYGTLQEYLTYKKNGGKLKPDLVLLAFYLHNDIKNNSEQLNASAKLTRGGKRKRPYLEQSDETQWRINPPDYSTINEEYLKRRNSLSFQIKYKSVLLTLMRNTGRALTSKFNAFESDSRLNLHRCESDERFLPSFRTTERIIRRLKTDVEAAGAQLVVFSVPAMFDTDTAFAQELELKAKSDGTELCVKDSPAYQKLAEILNRNGVEYIDLRPAFFKEAGGDAGELFVIGDWHWNGKGHAIAARAVYESLKTKGYLAR